MRKLRDRIFDIPIFLLLKMILILIGISNNFREKYLPGFLAFIFKRHRKYRSIVEKNLRLTNILKEEDKMQSFMDRVYFNISINAIDTLQYYKKSPKDADFHFIFERQDLIDYLKSNPCLYITAHIGNFEYLSSFFYGYGIKNTVIARKMDNPYIDSWTKKHREKYGHKIIYQEGSIYYIGSGFLRNENAFMLIDHRAPSNYTVWTNFFNIPTITLKVPAFFAIKQKISIVPVFCVKEKTGHRVILLDPVPVINSYSKDFNIWANTQRYSQILEQIIKKYPEQYLWSYKRWKQKPEEYEYEKYSKYYKRFKEESLSYNIN